MKPILGARLALAIAVASSVPALAQEPAAVPAAATPAAAATVTSEMMPGATTKALILDFAESGSRAIAVGERGQILVSESRTDWRQIDKVPTRANLNAVAAVGDQAWAVGHDGTIVHSADGGLTWTLQRSDPWRPLGETDEFDPRQGVPLLDVLMLDARNGIAVGAYSLMLRTTDGGATWTQVSTAAAVADEAVADAPEDAAPVDAEGTDAAAEDEDNWTFSDEDLELEDETDPHLNAIARTGSGALIVVGERGAAFRSRDGGLTWERLQLPYQGSMFGVIGYEGERVLAFGMRGNAFESSDLGATWTTVDTGTELTLMGGVALPDGGAALVGANGVVLHRASASAPIALYTYQTPSQETPVLSGVLAQGSTSLVVSGEKGVGQFQVQAK
jgi:photosystem II stability/assembly factor-like uncharacterized protein